MGTISITNVTNQKAPCFVTLFHKPTVFDSIYQDCVISLNQSAINSDAFFFEIWSSYNGAVQKFSGEEASQYIKQNFRIAKDLSILKSKVSESIETLQLYGSYATTKEQAVLNDRMLWILNNFSVRLG